MLTCDLRPPSSRWDVVVVVGGVGGLFAFCFVFSHCHVYKRAFRHLRHTLI